MTKPHTLRRRIWRWLRWILYPLLLFYAIKVVWVINFSTTGTEAITRKDRDDLLKRRAYLIQKVYRDRIGVNDMPTFLGKHFQGEWAIVSYSMTAVALTNLAFLYPSTRQESIRVLDQMITRVQDPSFRAFDKQKWGEDPLGSLSKLNGHIGYLGHLNMMLAARHFLSKNSKHLSLFHRISQALQRRFLSPSLLAHATYPGEWYIPDQSVVIASLALYEKLFPNKALQVPQHWLTQTTRKYRDPKTGLFAFQLDAQGQVAQTSRGSGSAWNLFYLWYVDPTFARKQYKKLHKHFFQSYGPWGGVREWKDPNKGGDVDSGPLLLGLSPAATGFAIAAALYSKDETSLRKMLLTAETAGFSLQWKGQRWYLTAPFVGDAILLAMRTVTVWNVPNSSQNQQ